MFIRVETFCIGKFEYVDKNQPVKIVRTENLQIETNSETGVEIYTKIEWKSECEYIMTYVKILNHSEDVSDAIGKKIFVKIIETEGNRISLHVKSDYMDEIVEMIKTE